MSTSTFLTLTINETVYDDIVPRTYRLDPETEELFYGEDLEEGMMVLLEDWQDRTDEELTGSLTNVGNLLVRNRWCRVTDLRRQGNISYFIGVYKDGHKTIRSSSNTKGWYVKKDSIPKNDPPEEKPLVVKFPSLTPALAGLKKYREGLVKAAESDIDSGLHKE
mgnify:CR=1 FL=1